MNICLVCRLDLNAFEEQVMRELKETELELQKEYPGLLINNISIEHGCKPNIDINLEIHNEKSDN